MCAMIKCLMGNMREMFRQIYFKILTFKMDYFLDVKLLKKCTKKKLTVIYFYFT